MKLKGYEYAAYNKRELQQILDERKLPVEGNRPELVSRLHEYDAQHPFPFLHLPAEIRHEIYTYVAASNYNNDVRKGGRPLIKPPTGTGNDDRSESQLSNIDLANKQNQAFLTPPGLFLTCSQVYRESRVVFFRHHEFRLHVWLQDDKGNDDEKEKGREEKGFLGQGFMGQVLQSWFGTVQMHRTMHTGRSRPPPRQRQLKNGHRQSGCTKKVFAWLDAIGMMQKEIRTLEIDLQCPFHIHEAAANRVLVQEYLLFIDRLHARLSNTNKNDDATTTTTYRTVTARHRPIDGVGVLWALGKTIHDRDPTHIATVPWFEIPAWIVPVVRVGWPWSRYQGDIWAPSRVYFREHEKRRRVGEPSLTFWPGAG